ncbi:MAG: DNA repair protein RecO [Bacilli bacterium]|nr:DNA repair protein RecO [Bacilli bacterium]
MKIIILSVTKYKDKDAIINAISEAGYVSLTAKGILDPKCKNHELNNILNIVDVDFIEGDYKYPIIKRSKALVSAVDLNSDYYLMSTLMLLSESTLHLLQENEFYKVFKSLEDAIMALKNGENYLKVALIYLARVISISGYQLEFNHCIYCGSKENIVSFSFVEGGFVCKNCATEDTTNDLSPKQLKLLRATFLVKDYNIPNNIFNPEDGLYLLNKYAEFVADGLGYKLNSIKLINK